MSGAYAIAVAGCVVAGAVGVGLWENQSTEGDYHVDILSGPTSPTAAHPQAPGASQVVPEKTFPASEFADAAGVAPAPTVARQVPPAQSPTAPAAATSPAQSESKPRSTTPPQQSSTAQRTQESTSAPAPTTQPSPAPTAASQVVIARPSTSPSQDAISPGPSVARPTAPSTTAAAGTTVTVTITASPSEAASTTAAEPSESTRPAPETSPAQPTVSTGEPAADGSTTTTAPSTTDGNWRSNESETASWTVGTPLETTEIPSWTVGTP